MDLQLIGKPIPPITSQPNALAGSSALPGFRQMALKDQLRGDNYICRTAKLVDAAQLPDSRTCGLRRLALSS